MNFFQFPQTIICQELDIFVKVNVYLVYACICVLVMRSNLFWYDPKSISYQTGSETTLTKNNVVLASSISNTLIKIYCAE